MKKQLTMPPMKTPSTNTPIDNMIKGTNNTAEVKPDGIMRRTTFVVDSALYKELKSYAVKHDVTITSLINDAIRDILKK